MLAVSACELCYSGAVVAESVLISCAAARPCPFKPKAKRYLEELWLLVTLHFPPKRRKMFTFFTLTSVLCVNYVNARVSCKNLELFVRDTLLLIRVLSGAASLLRLLKTPASIHSLSGWILPTNATSSRSTLKSLNQVLFWVNFQTTWSLGHWLRLPISPSRWKNSKLIMKPVGSRK